MSYCHIYFEKDHLSFSVERKNIIFLGKKEIHLSRYYKTYRIPVQFSWKDHLFIKFEENIIFLSGFFEKDHLSFSVQRIRSYFRKKEISSFLVIQERSYSTAIFLERSSFQTIWKKICDFLHFT